MVRSARVKMAHGELNRPVVKRVPVFYDGVSEIENGASDVGATSKPSDSENYRKPRLYHTARVTSRLSMDSSNVMTFRPTTVATTTYLVQNCHFLRLCPFLLNFLSSLFHDNLVDHSRSFGFEQNEAKFVLLGGSRLF